VEASLTAADEARRRRLDAFLAEALAPAAWCPLHPKGSPRLDEELHANGRTVLNRSDGKIVLQLAESFAA